MRTAKVSLLGLFATTLLAVACSVGTDEAFSSSEEALLKPPRDAGKADSATGSSDASTTNHCAPSPTSSTVVSVKDKGAKGDGTTNDTAAVQAAVDSVSGSGGTVLVPAGTYMIDALPGVNLGSKMTLQLAQGAILKAITNSADNYSVINVTARTNVNIVGGTLAGERNTHTGTTGEWGMGISVSGGSAIVIDGVTLKDMWGDGIYLTGQAVNTTVCSVAADNNRRQGMSIVGANGVVVKDSTFENTLGTNPMAGIDIEPNAGQSVTNVSITNSRFLSNGGSGIQVMGGGTAPVSAVTISGNTISNSGSNGGITCTGTSNDTITNNTISDTNNWGIFLDRDCSNITVTGNRITVSGGAAGKAIVDNGKRDHVSGNITN